ncbi:phosphatidate cytidylyltransferase [Flavobacterium sp. NRK F10]|uniref:Phosphatidate cytidylyltransferase n=1 Tax=Flavobacterium sediminis TaxID=2201181 RepID=A0A2U8QWC8_9FLAO|nr:MULTISPECIES: phosphatidate cytidylyltransferase [Flavobacterium]AWM14507.1 phosphatidate cytidylyltransferase [Flavobacterium sediminis]MCO6175738.1 phosphatidate cytidylyltransferase [Flavobacterium sp. NRK F10]
MNETLKRGITGAVYVTLLLSCVLYSKESFYLLFGFFLLVAVFEFCRLVSINKWIPLVSSLLIYSFFYNATFNPILDSIITGFTIAISIRLLRFLFNENAQELSIFSKYYYLFGYVIFPFVLLTKVPLGASGYNPKILISIIVLIWTNDTFAYLIGKNFGKRKLFPSISPKKTIEGFIAGILFSIICGYFLAKFYIHTKQFYFWIIIALIVSIFSTLGDLIESKFKRIAGVKDSGKIMPGHGGILDRLDSIIFVVPFIYLFYLILNILKSYVS